MGETQWNMGLMILKTALLLNFEIHCLSMQQLMYPGNVTVVGLFEVYEPENGGCGNTLVTSSVMEAEAIKWYFRKLNDAGDLPLKIGLEGHMTCRQDSLAAQIAIDVMSRSYRSWSGQETIIGLIGPSFSSEAEAISPILSSLKEESRLLMIGYSTTSVSLNSSRYPNIYRVVPNDDMQVDIMVQSLVGMGWNRIAIIYENDIYGQKAMQSLRVLSERHDICVAYTAYINTHNGIDSKEIEDISRSMLIGSPDLPTIGGFVFFGTSSTANLLLQKMNSLGLSDVPIGMFSEGINMDINAFRNLNRFIYKTKGSLIASPTYRAMEEFQIYWKGIFTDETRFEIEKVTNPWLNDLYFNLKPCSQPPCSFLPMSDTEFEGFFPDQPLYVQYAIIAAHAVAKTFKLSFETFCPGASTSCDLSTFFKPGDMIDRVRNIQLNFETDFQIRLESLNGVKMSFHANGEPNVGLSTAYQLYNLRQINNGVGDVSFVKVGDFVNDTLQLDVSSIVDYEDDDLVSSWPDVRKGVCGPDKLCHRCIPDDLPFWSFHEPGDFYIVGLVPVFDTFGTQGCSKIRTFNGYQLAEAIKFAVQKINEPGGEYENKFKESRVGVIILNTCNNPAVIQRHILNLHKDGLLLANGDVINVENKILGYAGPLGSTVSIAVSRLLGTLKKVSISYAATSPALSDRDIYKYFMRVVSPDNEQANAMAKILEELGANYVQALYSEGAYGEAGIATLKEILKSKGICIVQDIKVPESGNYYAYYEYLRKYPHAKIVIVFLRSHVVKPLMDALTDQIERGQFIFIGSEAWGKSTELLEKNSPALLGSFTVVVEMAENSELLSIIQKIKPETYSVNPWSQQYLQAKWQCHYNNSFDKRTQTVCAQNFAPMTSLHGWETLAYISALSMLIGSGSYLESVCGTTVKELCEDYLNNPEGNIDIGFETSTFESCYGETNHIEFDQVQHKPGCTTIGHGLIRTIKTEARLDVFGNGFKQNVFNDNGDGIVGYAIYNIQKDVNDPQKLTYKKVGQYPLSGSFTFDKSLITYPTDEEMVSRCPNEQACAGCAKKGGTTLTGEKDRGMAVATIVLLVLFLLSLAAVAVLAVLFFRVRRKQYKDQQVYLTPATPAEERHRTNFLAMSNFERPAVLGENTEICTEPPHKTSGQYTREIVPASTAAAKESISANVL